MGDRLKRSWYWVRSFSKRQWGFEDYPVAVRRMDNGEYFAQILGWATLAGLGPTREAALENLEENFALRLAKQDTPVRPGCQAPIEFAESSRVGSHGDFAYDFVEKVTGIRPFFMSDFSTLMEFADTEDDEDRYRALIREEYGVDIEGVLMFPLRTFWIGCGGFDEVL